MNVLPKSQKLFPVSCAAVCESLLPYRKLRSNAMREATFDEADYSFERCVLRCEQQMDVFRHDDKIVQKKMAFAAIMLQRFEE